MHGRLREIIKHYVMFALSCSIGTVVDIGAHWILSITILSGSYWAKLWVAPFISFELAAITNFFIAYYFVWKERITNRNRRSLWRHFAAFNATSFGAFLIKFAVMQGVHFFLVYMNWMQNSSFEPAFCNIISLLFSGGFNFFMNEFVIFKKKKPAPEKTLEAMGE